MVRVRRAESRDAAALADLTAQLGYPVDATELARRLDSVLADQRSALLVAADGSDGVVGWLHVVIRHLLERPPSALIAGFVVDERHRSEGIGQRLLEAGEEWAHAQGVASMTLYSRQTRTRAHRFYLREGYRIAKESYFFEKGLP